MKKLLKSIKNLKKTRVRELVDSRVKEFKQYKSKNKLFSELCFCLLTANFQAERAIKIQNKIGNGFLTLPKAKLAKKLLQLGHRFPNARANYIYEARKHKNNLKNKSRDWLVKNIKGLGYKESSHFLRNIGYTNYALIDFHIIDLLEQHKIIKRPKTLTKRKYLEIESTLKKIADKTNLNQAQLDLYLWYMETGKVLK